MPPRFRPTRPLGRTGFVATAIGAGDLADRSVPKDRCVSTLRRALDAGVNVVDTAPMYEDGYSEEIVGEALPRRRVPRRQDRPPRSPRRGSARREPGAARPPERGPPRLPRRLRGRRVA